MRRRRGLASDARGGLPYTEALLELFHINDTAAMSAIADLAVAVPSLDVEYDAPGIDLDDSRTGTDLVADWSRSEVTDLHVHANADEALWQMRSDGGA